MAIYQGSMGFVFVFMTKYLYFHTVLRDRFFYGCHFYVFLSKQVVQAVQ